MALQVAAVASSGASPIVRTVGSEPWMIKRVLDCGAHAIMVPMCETKVWGFTPPPPSPQHVLVVPARLRRISGASRIDCTVLQVPVPPLASRKPTRRSHVCPPCLLPERPRIPFNCE